MKIKQHPSSGLWVSDTGLICMPPVRGRTSSKTFRWTPGYLRRSGYRVVTWKKVRYHVHRMILETFGPAPSEGRSVVDHINRIKDDNRIENLRWATYSENTLNSSRSDTAMFSSEGIHYGPEYIRRHNRVYYEAHKERLREYARAYRARKRKNPDDRCPIRKNNIYYRSDMLQFASVPNR